jgi:predicted RecA/RadA family phage recombinase
MAQFGTYKRGEIKTAKYLAGANIAVGQLVPMGLTNTVKSRIGIAMSAIANGATGIVAVSGVWELTKVTGAVIKAGEGVSFDASADNIDDNVASPAVGDITDFGCAMADAGAGVLVVDVDIEPWGTYKAS